MKIRKYLAKDIQEAIRLIKGDLGPDALIIGSKKVYGRGLLGFFRRQLEVTAALDEYPAALYGANNNGGEPGVPSPQTARNNINDYGGVRTSHDIDIHREIDNIKSLLNKVIQHSACAAQEAYGVPAQAPVPIAQTPAVVAHADPAVHIAQAQVAQTPASAVNACPAVQSAAQAAAKVEPAVEFAHAGPAAYSAQAAAQAAAQTAQSAGTPASNVHADPATYAAPVPATPGHTEQMHTTQAHAALVAQWRGSLLQMGLDEAVAQKLIDACNLTVGGDLTKFIADILQPIYQCEDRGKNARIMSFVGPTGVGKTTTLAKLAARYKLFEQKEVAMITMDTYRIGAVEQLRTYGEILGVPVETVLTPEEMAEALKKHSEKDMVLIDTAGRSPYDEKNIAELAKFLKTVGPHDVNLVLSSNTRAADLSKYANHFKELQYNKFIFTKLDETDVYGSIVNVMCGHSLPVSFITNGQNVPDDIHEMNPGKIADLLFKGVAASD